MCMIDGADERYLEVEPPTTFTAKRCGDCGGQDLEGAEIFAGISPSDLPDLYLWCDYLGGWVLYDEHEHFFETAINYRRLSDNRYQQTRFQGFEWRPLSGTVEGLWSLGTYYYDDGELPPGLRPDQLDPNVHVICARCLAARRWLEEWCHGWMYDMVREDIIEHWYDNEVVRHVALGRLVLLAKRRWRNRRGQLVDVSVITDLVARSLAYMEAKVADAKAP